MDTYVVPTDLCVLTLNSLWSKPVLIPRDHASEFSSPNNPHPPSNEHYDDFSSDVLFGDASILPMAHHFPFATGLPLNNVPEILPFDHIIFHFSGVPLVAISPSDFFQTFNAPPIVDPLSPIQLSPCESQIGGGNRSGTSHASSTASPSPVTLRDSSAPPKRTKNKGSPKGRSKASVIMRRIKREEGPVKEVEATPTGRASPRRVNRKPARYVYDAPYPTSSPLLSDPEPDTDEEWKPDDSMTSDHEDNTSISNVDDDCSDYDTTRIGPGGVPLIAPPPNAAIAISSRTERERIRSFAQRHNRTPSTGSAQWVLHGGQFLCKAIVRQESKRGRAKWLPGIVSEVGKPCNQLFGTYQDWERHFSCSQWHQEPDTCQFCEKSLNVRSVERHLGKCTTSLLSNKAL